MESLPVLNTFIHLEEPDAKSRRRCLRRISTDPTEPVVFTKKRETVGEPAPTPQRPAEKDAVSEVKQTNFRVDGARLSSTDTRIVKTQYPIVLTLTPRKTSDRKGGASFKASRGVCEAQLKHNDPSPGLTQVTVKIAKVVHTLSHDFSCRSLLKLPGTYNLHGFTSVDISIELAAAKEEAECSEQSEESTDIAEEAWQHDSCNTPSTCSPPSSAPATPWLSTPVATPRSSRHQASPEGELDFTFEFTMRRADGYTVGLDVALDRGYVMVNQVHPGGAIHSWNMQCQQNDVMGVKAVVPGDVLLSVNGKTTHQEIVDEFSKYLLRFTVVRKVPAVPLMPLMFLDMDALQYGGAGSNSSMSPGGSPGLSPSRDS